MDSTLVVILSVIALLFLWAASIVIKLSRTNKAPEKESVKDQLFGKKRKSRKAEKGQFWALE